MFRIEKKEHLNDTVGRMEILAPRVAKKALPGQFVILRAEDEGERIPLTVAGTDPDRGTVEIIYQIVGATTKKLDQKEAGECLPDFVGPLGRPTEIEGRKVCVIGGGVGCAIALPVARAFAAAGAEVVGIMGFREKGLVILEEEFRVATSRLYLMTDDGSYGEKGNVCAPLEKMLSAGEKFDRILAVGPLIMMKFVVAAARPYKTPVTVSMNPIMIDGTGMCGGCRLTLTGEDGKRETKFACVDGPEFDGYKVDFDEAMRRGAAYRDFERRAYEETCSLLRQGKEAR